MDLHVRGVPEEEAVRIGSRIGIADGGESQKRPLKRAPKQH